MRLTLVDAKSHREVLAQLRRYQTLEQPCFEEVAVIEGALTGLTEPESRALTERRRMEKNRQERAAKRERDERWEESWQREGWNRRETLRKAINRAKMLLWAAACIEKNVGGVELVKAFARALDTEMGDSFESLCWQRCEVDGHGEESAKLRQNGNVICGPWDTAG